MSAAGVEYDAMDGQDPATAPHRFAFRCPKSGQLCGHLVIAGRTTLKRDPQNKNDGIAQWDWDGNREAPTFHPSINCKHCWHGYIVEGRCVDTARKDMPEPRR